MALGDVPAKKKSSLSILNRIDGWINSITGFGTPSRDRSVNTAFFADDWLTWAEISNLFHYDDLCRRIVSIFPEEALRRGWRIEGPDPNRAAQLTRNAKQLQIVSKIREGAKLGRAFGGAVAVLGIVDYRNPGDELYIDGPTPVQFADVYDVRRVWRDLAYSDPAHPSYAKARIFRITPMYGEQFYVHRSRCLVFGGAFTADQEKEQRAGWDASVLQAPYGVIRDFQNSYGSVVHLLSDASTSVFKLKGLLDAVANKTQEDLTTRMQLMDLTRSVFRSVMLDADYAEEFKKEPTTFSGLAEIIDRINYRLSCATEIPVTVLMGSSPAGLNATGESDIRIWYDRIEAYRREEIEPHLERYLEIVAPGEGYKFVFPPLWQPDPKTQAESRKTLADADAIYLDREVLLPEEVARARFGADGWQDDVKADPTLRTKPETAPSPTVANATPAKTAK